MKARSFPYKIDSDDLRLLLKEARLSGFGIGWVDYKYTYQPKYRSNRRDETFRSIKDIDKVTWQHDEIVIIEGGWKRAHYKRMEGGSTWFDQTYPGTRT